MKDKLVTSEGYETGECLNWRGGVGGVSVRVRRAKRNIMRQEKQREEACSYETCLVIKIVDC